MPTLAEVTAYRSAQNEIVSSARNRLARLWGRLDVWEIDRVRDALEVTYPALVAQYGDASAALAADWYEQQTGTPATAAPPVSEDVANGRMRWAIGGILTDGPAAALSLLRLITDQHVKQPGRDTIADSAHMAGIGWARVPSGGETCAFCLMLASRGAVYESAKTAGDGGTYHGDCDCVATPIRDASDLPSGYDPDALDAIYVKARTAAGSGDPDAILVKMREHLGTH
jgi:hypothetical protein